MLQRQLAETIISNYKKGFIDIIYGPRRIGKTVLISQILDKLKNLNTIDASNNAVKIFNGDYLEDRELLSDTSFVHLKKIAQTTSVLVIDEAQRIPNISLSLKILIDAFPNLRIIVTGSSSLHLSKGAKEVLTGRTQAYNLYPLSTAELGKDLQEHQLSQLLENQLIYGGYPQLINFNKNSDKEKYLISITKDYLLRDIIDLKQTTPETLLNLAKLLAFQVGSEVSLNELSKKLGIDIKTVKRYLSLLKESFIIFELSAWSTNLRKEIVKNKKYYFWDTGIRNALIGQFASISIRPDKGNLWENFLIIERVKTQHYSQELKNYYFWRSYDQAEIDWIEEDFSSVTKKLEAFEFKWNKSKVVTPKSFVKNYSTKAQVVNKKNYLDFVTNQ
jgi:uncharacterized protein